MIKIIWTFPLLLHWLLTITSALAQQQTYPQTCTWEDHESCQGGKYVDKHLQPMEFSILGDGQEDQNPKTEDIETFYAYVAPHISYAYNSTPESDEITPKETTFTGMFGKFINLSPKKLQVYWLGQGRANPVYIADLDPFGSAGTATYPGHNFIFVNKGESNPTKNILKDIHVVKDNSLYYFDPFNSIEIASQLLEPEELELYKLQYRNVAFNRVYEQKTGRQYLGLYGRKHQPLYPMWPADYFGQHFEVETKETHFVDLPPDDFAKKRISSYGTTEEERDMLHKYRTPGVDILKLNMTVISVEPRAYEIQNFLSEDEVHHMMELATGIKLSRSTTKAGSSGSVNDQDTTRTSDNSWMARYKSPIVDSIFRRAADLLQIDESLFRDRHKNESHFVDGSDGSISERLQVVHYDVGQQYTPHHVSCLVFSHGPPYLKEIKRFSVCCSALIRTFYSHF